jgi:hypothetical protein
MKVLGICAQTHSCVQLPVWLLVKPLLFHVLLLYNMFRSHKDHRQLCILLRLYCYTVGSVAGC